MKPIRLMLSPLSSLARLTLLGAFAASTAAVASAQSSVVPIPFATSVAGLAAGSGNTQCSAASDIPNNAGVHLGDGCLPTQAVLVGGYGAFTDNAGNVYYTENGTNNDIRVIYKGGAIMTQLLIAANAQLTNFTPIVGRIYTLAGSASTTLTKVGSKYPCNGQSTGISALDSAGDGCPGAQAYIKPRGMFVDPNGNVFFVSTGGGNTVKVLYAGGAQVAALITAENPGVIPQLGYVYKLSGQSSASYSGDNALASAAALIVVRDVVVDSSGNVYISDGTSTATSGNNVRVIYGGGAAPAGISNPTLGFIYTFAGAGGCTQPASSCAAGDTGDGGAARSALLNGPYTLFLDRFDNLYISEYSGNRLRVVYNSGTIGGIASPTSGNIYTYAGGGALTADNSPANQVALGSVQVSGIDQAGNIYVEDGTSKRIWKFDALTSVGYVIAGRSAGSAPTAGTYCNGVATGPGPMSVDTLGDGCPATQASLSDAGRISFDPQGNMYLGENGNAVIRRLSYNTQFPATAVAASSSQWLAFKALTAATLATETISQQGSSTNEYKDAGTGTCTATSALTAAQVCTFSITFTPAKVGLRPALFQLSTAGAVVSSELLSGVGLGADLAIDPATQVSAGTGITPSGIATDLLGNVYVSDQTGNRVLKGSSSATTLAPLVTGLKSPAGLAVDGAGNVYIADTGNNRILEANAAGATVATFGTSLNAPQGVAVDAFGNIFVADTGNNRVVEITPNGVQTVFTAIMGLTAPAQITFDPNGNLYVADTGNSRVVEVAVNGNQATFTLPSGVKPTGIAVDASGTLYVTDATGLQLLAFAPGVTTGNVLLSGLIKPAALAVDQDANVYIADTGVSSATYLRRNLASIKFPITNVNQSSTSAVNLNNVGNAALNFTSTTLYTLTGSNAFSLAPSTTNGCGFGVSFAVGGACSLTATFTPTTTGAASASVTFNTNAVNAATATALLTGNGQQLVATTSTIAVTSPTGTITYGQTVTVTATVTPTSNAGAATGTVTFTIDNKAQTPLPYGNGSYTLTLNPAVGTHTVSVAFSGDGIYASSSATTSFTVAKASTTTTLALSTANNNGSTTLTFTATVSSPTANTETGTVSFYAGTTLLTTVPLNATTHVATYSTSTLTYTPNSFTAVYSGDTNFAGSTSAAATPTGDFAIGITASAVTVPQGGVANINYSLNSLYAGAGTVTPTCTGLPANSVCRFNPVTVTIANGGNAVQLQIYTNVSSTLAHNSGKPFGPRSELFFASLLPLSLLAFKRRSRLLRAAGIACAFALMLALPLTGCGSGSSAATQSDGLVTPLGTSTVTVTFAGAAPLTTHSTTLSLTVIGNNTTF